MIVDCKYTLEQIKRLAGKMVALVGSREKQNGHITEYFDRKGIAWRKETLQYGDYSFLLPACEESGIAKGGLFPQGDRNRAQGKP